MDRYENIPFQKGFGTVIAERVVDLVLLLLCILLALGLQFDLIADYLNLKDLNFFQTGLSLIILMIIFILFQSLSINLPNHYEKIKQFFQGIWEGNDFHQIH